MSLIPVGFSISYIQNFVTLVSGIYLFFSSYSDINNKITQQTAKVIDLKIINSIHELDLNHTIKVLESLILEINKKDISTYKYPDTLFICIDSIRQCFEDIRIQLDIITTRLQYNTSLYFFKTIRSYGFDNRIKQLNILKAVLDERKKLLLHIISQ